MLHESEGINYESDKNILNAARIGHELTENRRLFATIREIFSHDSYKKGPYMLRVISSKINVLRKAAVELILQLEC